MRARSVRFVSIGLAALFAALPFVGCRMLGIDAPWDGATSGGGVEAIDDARLRNAASEPESWLTYGGTYSEQRHSRLDAIDESNVSQLGLAWSLDLDTKRGLEATPIVVDGVIYTTGTWSVAYAIDARTGKVLWRHDPEVPRSMGGRVCCDVVNRGVAIYEGRVYLGVLDGRLQALDAKTGEVDWSVWTVDPERPYSITMAPRIVKGRVIVGNGGAEFGVRGYVSAYDAESGELDWRFYTVPGDPAKPFEHPELEAAAKTWNIEDEYWKVGGGGTAWNSISYDPDLDLLYVGTGNGSPWSKDVRSGGEGDNLYVCSILALDPETGRLAWHYQTTPGDKWDYTSTQDIVLADLEIDGVPRKTLLHAPKNGFFYVIDRETGVPISVEPFVPMNWATGIDRETWRPIEDTSHDYSEIVTIEPSPHGAHNWHPMSFNPDTGLVYIPAQEAPFFFLVDANFEYRPGAWNVGYDKSVLTISPPDLVSGHLLAWDPIEQKEVWRAQYTGAWNGGTLSTAGNLVFQGTAHGTFAAYRASDGELLWEEPAGTGIVAAPVTFELDGEQFVAVMAGWGGAFPLSGGEAASEAGVTDNSGRLLVYELGGSARLPVHEAIEREITALPADFTPAAVKAGSDTYHHWCLVCHGPGAIGGGVLPDLRKSAPEIYTNLETIVLGGAFEARGMPRFDKWLGPEDVDAIRTYLLSRRAEMLGEGARAAQ